VQEVEAAAAAAMSESSGGHNNGGEWTQAVDYTGAVVAAFTPELTEAMLAATGVPLSELEGAFTYDAPAPSEALEVVRACRRRPRGSGVATVPLRLGDCTYLLKGVAGVGGAGSAVFEAYPLMDADDVDAADDDANVFALKVRVRHPAFWGPPQIAHACSSWVADRKEGSISLPWASDCPIRGIAPKRMEEQPSPSDDGTLHV